MRMEGLTSFRPLSSRLPGLVERKERIGKVKLLKMRSKKHAEWAIDEGEPCELP